MGRLRTFTGCVAILAMISPALAADLSPGAWPAAERQRLEQREAAIWPAAIRTASGSRGIVTGTASPVAVHAGAEALRQGGTAADAAVATALTQVTMMLGANVSHAGIAELVYYEARTGRVFVLDAGWNSWRGERSPATIPNTDISMITGTARSTTGAAGRKALVPGFMAGMQAIADRFGRLRLGTLLAPSIWYAEHGVPVTPMLGAYFGLAGKTLEQTPEGRAFALPDGVNVPQAGERFVQPALAATLRAVARDGARAMYRGEWARQFVETLRARGGAATMADMAAYRPSWTTPQHMAFAGGTLFGPDEANQNGCAIMMALNVLDHAGPVGRYWEDGIALRTTALALRAAVSAPYAPEVAAFEHRIGMGGNCAARLTPAYGVAAAGALETLGAATAAPPPGHHSASVVAIDRWGNVAVLVHSSNSPIWGDTGMVVGGIPVPVPAGINQARLTMVAPGSRVPGDMAPMLLLRGGEPQAAIATIGTSLVQETVRLLLGLGQGGDMAAWLAAPPLLFNIDSLTGPMMAREELLPPGAYSPALAASLRQHGFPVREVDAQRVLILRGTAAVAMVRPDPATREAVEVPGVMTFAEAE